MKAVLVISDRDNVATALQPLAAGQVIEAAGTSVVVAEAIGSGHKVALRRIDAGEAVIKYGSPIGTASTPIAVGAHVHTHNVSSDRGRGDLEVTNDTLAPRLAEPPDAASDSSNGTTSRVINK